MPLELSLWSPHSGRSGKARGHFQSVYRKFGKAGGLREVTKLRLPPRVGTREVLGNNDVFTPNTSFKVIMIITEALNHHRLSGTEEQGWVFVSRRGLHSGP